MFIALLIAYAFFYYRRSLRYLRFLQQEQYHTFRYIDWIYQSKAWDTKASVLLLLLFLIYLRTSLTDFFTGSAAVVFFILSLLEPNPTKMGKIRLHLTARAKKILFTHLSISYPLLIISTFIDLPFQPLALVVIIQLAPFLIALSNWALIPFEKKVQKKYLKEASQLIHKANPVIIGITGSYGKTSTKHYLSTLLSSCKGATYWPQDGINSLMGITRHIRENLNIFHEYAVIEMGAHYPGSIAKLCKLTPPFASIITTIGFAHLERFKDQETIFKAKSELAQATSDQGILVVNGDDPLAMCIAKNNPKKIVSTFGNNPKKHTCAFTNLNPTPEGTTFTLHYKDASYPAFVPLHGRHHIANVCAAFLMSAELGANPISLLSALPLLSPVSQRLNIQQSKGITYFHDAYNSNPIGFKNALDLLKELQGSRRIVLTPGFIELGPKQYEENYAIALETFKTCDVIYQIGKTNRKAFEIAYQKMGQKKQFFKFDHRDEAFAHYKMNKSKCDLVLIENDLPDLYEHNERF